MRSRCLVRGFRLVETHDLTLRAAAPRREAVPCTVTCFTTASKTTDTGALLRSWVYPAPYPDGNRDTRWGERTWSFLNRGRNNDATSASHDIVASGLQYPLSPDHDKCLRCGRVQRNHMDTCACACPALRTGCVMRRCRPAVTLALAAPKNLGRCMVRRHHLARQRCAPKHRTTGAIM